MNWKDKLSLLLCIIYDLVAVHSQGIIHRDLHSGNILLDNLHSAYIADLGLSIQYLKQYDEVYGVLPFVAPEVLVKKPYTTASDIYSFGIIMWEVLYGESSTCYFKQDQVLNMLDIVCGTRPKVNETDSNCYIELMKNCWHQDPRIRPTADYLCETFKSWRDDEQIISNLHKFKTNIDSEYIKKLDTTPKCYTSKLLNLENLFERINKSTPDELREYLSKNTHIPTEINHSIPHISENLIISENMLNSDQIKNLFICMQENNEKINIIHKSDETNVDNPSAINTDKIDIDVNEIGGKGQNLGKLQTRKMKGLKRMTEDDQTEDWSRKKRKD
ncbi:kinase-like domain-containing protein [Gigaspora rosea]|uniref:Kinase-like domain-containing protein n=1 Tax=Gigaspora rosea TaxID=44941 RepID=A0A397VQU6_9GLOM|nr:kinase-like domain-containing protein [Gigaspora rosea]